MKAVILIVMTLALMPTAQGLIVTPELFEGAVEHGEVYTNHFRVVPENLSQTVILYSSSPFFVEFDRYSLIDISTWVDVEFNITIPSLFPEGVYISYIFVMGENESKVVEVILTVERTLNFSIVPPAAIEVGMGDYGFFPLTLRNDGNDIIEMSVSIVSSGISVFFDNSQMDGISLYPNISIQIPIGYAIPNNVSQGNYSVNITVFDRDQNASKTTNISVTVFDNIDPEFRDLQYPGIVRAGLPFQLRATVIDNFGIEEVKFDFGNNNTLISTEPKEGVHLVTNTLNDIGNFTFITTVTDSNGNDASRSDSIKVKQYDGVKFPEIDYVKIVKEELHRFDIFNSNISIPFCLEFDYFDYIPSGSSSNATHDYFLYIDDIKERFNVTIGENETPGCFNGRNLELAFKASHLGRLDTEFIVSFDDWIQDSERIIIGTDVADRTIERNRNIRIGSQNLNCTYTFSDDWLCLFDVPGRTRLEEMGVFLTDRGYNDIVRASNQTAVRAELERDSARATSYFQWVVISIFVLVGSVYFIYEILELDIDWPGR